MSHLNKDRWFRKTTTGRTMLKRVSAAAEHQFPRVYREVYRDAANNKRAAAAVLCKYLIENHGYRLASAWEHVKWMFNNKPEDSKAK